MFCEFLQKLKDKHFVSFSSLHFFFFPGMNFELETELEHLNLALDFVSHWGNPLVFHFTEV